MSPSTTQALQSEPNKALHRTVNGAAEAAPDATAHAENRARLEYAVRRWGRSN
ncbi:MAG: hypothetical protein O6950_09550 [Gammaproteobacteria bacterium]|nr:hypothetical protein [Gammaproteobacteria bacterium]